MRRFAELRDWIRTVQGRLMLVMVVSPLVPVVLALACALVWGVGVVRHAQQEFVAQRAGSIARTLGQWVQRTLEVAPMGTEASLRALGGLALAWIEGPAAIQVSGGVITDANIFSEAAPLLAQEGPLVSGALRTFPVPGIIVGLRQPGGLRCLFLDLGAVERWLDGLCRSEDAVILHLGGGQIERGPLAKDSWARAVAAVPGLPWTVELASPEKWGLSAERWLGLFLVVFLVAGGVVVVGFAVRTSGAVGRLLAQYNAQHDALRDALSRAELLAQLGSMAAGFAHEINNPLQIMKSEQAYMRILLDGLLASCPQAQQAGAELQESMQQLEGQIHRCSRITHAILGFGRLSTGEPHIVDLCRFLPEVVATFRTLAEAAGARLEVACGPDRLLVRLDPAKLHQVLANLLSNAMHAVEGKADAFVQVRGVADGGRVLVIVEDNGCGIAPEHRESIFTPFFTTKGPDKGTGLGLPICYTLVQTMGGSLDFESTMGQGTRFVVSLPRLLPA